MGCRCTEQGWSTTAVMESPSYCAPWSSQDLEYSTAWVGVRWQPSDPGSDVYRGCKMLLLRWRSDAAGQDGILLISTTSSGLDSHRGGQRSAAATHQPAGGTTDEFQQSGYHHVTLASPITVGTYLTFVITRPRSSWHESQCVTAGVDDGDDVAATALRSSRGSVGLAPALNPTARRPTHSPP